MMGDFCLLSCVLEELGINILLARKHNLRITKCEVKKGSPWVVSIEFKGWPKNIKAFNDDILDNEEKYLDQIDKILKCND